MNNYLYVNVNVKSPHSILLIVSNNWIAVDSKIKKYFCTVHKILKEYQ